MLANLVSIFFYNHIQNINSNKINQVELIIVYSSELHKQKSHFNFTQSGFSILLVNLLNSISFSLA